MTRIATGDADTARLILPLPEDVHVRQHERGLVIQPLEEA